MCERFAYIRQRMSSSRPQGSGRSRAAAKAETREALLRAALAAFAEDGFDAPSLDAICARAGLTRGAFYVHFADRDALVVAVVERAVERFLDAIVSTEGTASDLRASIERFVAAVELVPGTRGATAPLLGGELLPPHRILDAARRSPAIRRRLIGIAREATSRLAQAATSARRAGLLRPDIDPQALAALLVTAAVGVLVATEIGLPLEFRVLRDTVLALLGPLSLEVAGGARTRRPRPGRRV